jgi:DNA-binding MarR family transcriptional regulator
MTMTEIQNATTATAPRPAVPIGQAIGQTVGQAEAALSRLLAGILAETGTTRETYLALQRMAALGDGPLREDYARDLNDALGLDLWAAGNLVDTLVSAGLLAAGEGGDDTVRLTPAGTELRGKLQDSVRAVNAPLWESLDAVVLDTTIKTLQEITARARALRAVGHASENGEG